MKILVHDYPGYAFPIQLSRELAKRGHRVLHAFASQLQCIYNTESGGETEVQGARFIIGLPT